MVPFQRSFPGAGPSETWPITPPPPLPIAAPSVRSDFVAAVPQTMRQFTANAGVEASGLGSGPGFHTPRSGSGGQTGFDVNGYPVSPGGTVIRPPPGPPPQTSALASWEGPGGFERVPQGRIPEYRVAGSGEWEGNVGMRSCGASEVQGSSSGGPSEAVRPEEPAKYINELPKLNQVELSQSAVVCGNWLAQVRQVLVGLSPSANVWWQGVENPATLAYRRWLVADPLGRLSIDPSSVVGEFDRRLYGRVESRAVSLLLAAVPQSVRDEVVTNRWLASSSILFRVLCLFQPGGSSERSHLLSQLVNPDPCRSFAEAIKGLRKWQQGLQRAGEIHATLPDASLLLRGLDGATSALLTSHPMRGFRVNAFRHQLAIDYNPTVANVVQLVRLIQAECEAASITSEGAGEKRARTAALQTPKDPPASKSVPTPPPPPAASLAVVSAEKGGGKDKGAGKGKGGEGTQQLCHKFSDASGCRYGDACIFKHDRARARKKGKCLACGKGGHIRPDCPLVAPENRVTLDSGAEGSPKSASPGQGKAGGKGKVKAKAGAQAKGITEETASASVASASAVSGSTSATPSPEALVAEAAKLLKGVTLKPLRVEVDESWIRSALASASNPDYCLMDSGATNALRPAAEEELSSGRAIRVDLASGMAELRINSYGTVLHAGPCQVILPANYLIQLGFSIVWRRKGCRIKHPKKGCLDVTVVKGCPLVSREMGLLLLREYEELQAGVPVLSKSEVQDLVAELPRDKAREWLCSRVSARRGEGLTEVDQLTFLRGVFPRVPLEILGRVCVPALREGFTDWSELPWNRRFRRSIFRSSPGEVLLSVSRHPQSWKGLGRVISVSEAEKGLGSRVVFQLLMCWAELGLIGGLIWDGFGDSSSEELAPLVDGTEFSWDLRGLDDLSKGGMLRGSVRALRLFLLFSVAQAVKDGSKCEGTGAGARERGEASVQMPKNSPLAGAGGSTPQSKVDSCDRSRVFLVCGLQSLAGSGSKDAGVRWDPVSVREFAEVYDLYHADFDQGCLGGSEIGDTSLLASSWFLYEALHELRVSPEVRRLWQLSNPCEGTARRANLRWTGGLCRTVRGAWSSWCVLGSRSQEVAERQGLLKKLTQEEAYARHVAHDHVPYLKGCPICIGAQGRQCSHWRSSFVGVHSASFDIAGPFVSGQAYNVEASGRDKGTGYKYFLACAYTVPEGYSSRVDQVPDWQK